jgi:hypothetical protein
MRKLVKEMSVLVGVEVAVIVGVCVKRGVGVFMEVNVTVAVVVGMEGGVGVCAGIPPRSQADSSIAIRITHAPHKYRIRASFR